MSQVSREALMRNLQMMSFVLDDIALYLQTHPTDQDALRYYEKYRKKNIWIGTARLEKTMYS